MNSMDAKVLRRAAELIDMGHSKWSLVRDASGECVDAADLSCDAVMHPDAAAWCIAGAFIRAEAEILGTPTAGGAAWWKRGLPRLMSVIKSSPVVWNNAPGRTADEVAAALRAAADRCEAA